MIRPPSSFQRRANANESPLDYEIAQEKAAALGRLGRGLEKALADLAAFDAACASNAFSHEKATRTVLLDAAGQALWLFLVQRDACGLRDARAVMRDYRVPAEVQNRAGAFPTSAVPKSER